MLTLEEQERLAYISGDTRLAALLDEAACGQAAVEGLERLEERVADLEHENDELKGKIDRATSELTA